MSYATFIHSGDTGNFLPQLSLCFKDCMTDFPRPKFRSCRLNFGSSNATGLGTAGETAWETGSISFSLQAFAILQSLWVWHPGYMYPMGRNNRMIRELAPITSNYSQIFFDTKMLNFYQFFHIISRFTFQVLGIPFYYSVSIKNPIFFSENHLNRRYNCIKVTDRSWEFVSKF